MTVSYIPDGTPTISPYIMIRDLDAAIQFYQTAFDAEITQEEPNENGDINGAQMRVGSSIIMLGQHTSINVPSPTWEDLPALSLYLYVEDCDTVHQQSIKAGATELEPVERRHYGDRRGAIVDPFGVLWWIATQVEIVPKEEYEERARQSKSE